MIICNSHQRTDDTESGVNRNLPFVLFCGILSFGDAGHMLVCDWPEDCPEPVEGGKPTVVRVGQERRPSSDRQPFHGLSQGDLTTKGGAR